MSSNKKVPTGTTEAISNFINIPAGDQTAPADYRFKIDKDKELRKRRVGFVMTNADYDEMKAYCDNHEISVSEFINQAVKWVMHHD